MKTSRPPVQKPSVISQITHSIIGGRAISAIAIPNPPRVDFKRLRHPDRAQCLAQRVHHRHKRAEREFDGAVVRSSAAALINLNGHKPGKDCRGNPNSQPQDLLIVSPAAPSFKSGLRAGSAQSKRNRHQRHKLSRGNRNQLDSEQHRRLIGRRGYRLPETSIMPANTGTKLNIRTVELWRLWRRFMHPATGYPNRAPRKRRLRRKPLKPSLPSPPASCSQSRHTAAQPVVRGRSPASGALFSSRRLSATFPADSVYAPGSKLSILSCQANRVGGRDSTAVPPCCFQLFVIHPLQIMPRRCPAKAETGCAHNAPAPRLYAISTRSPPSINRPLRDFSTGAARAPALKSCPQAPPFRQARFRLRPARVRGSCASRPIPSALNTIKPYSGEGRRSPKRLKPADYRHRPADIRPAPASRQAGYCYPYSG